jgi:ketosteroid isomerase-like protein
MTAIPSTARGTPTWEEDIRDLEEKACAAFVAADISTMERLLAEEFVVNSPLQQIADRPRMLSLLESGRIRHHTYDIDIEHISRHGDVVVVMGRDRVTGPPLGGTSHRRFTNIWQLVGGSWRLVARHAHVVSREADED